MSEEEEVVETVKRKLNADDGASRSSRGTTTEVKIRMTKRELEKLLSEVEMEELPVTELLLQLIEVGDELESTHRRSWRPSLQSIPEMS